MSKRSSAGKLVKQVATTPSRRSQYSASTRRALMEAAQGLFTTQGYAATSLDAVVAEAAVTKGALYHHYSGKQGLFEAVFEAEEAAAVERIVGRADRAEDPWDRAAEALRGFLEVVREPGYQRIVIQDGPAILGYERFRETGGRTAHTIVRDIVHGVLDALDLASDEAMVETFTDIFHGAITSAGEAVANAADPDEAAARVDTAVGFLLAGLRALAESGLQVVDVVAVEPGGDEPAPAPLVGDADADDADEPVAEDAGPSGDDTDAAAAASDDPAAERTRSHSRRHRSGRGRR